MATAGYTVKNRTSWRRRRCRSLTNGNWLITVTCRAFIASWHRPIRSMPPCISRCLSWLRFRPWPSGVWHNHASSGTVEQRCPGDPQIMKRPHSKAVPDCAARRRYAKRGRQPVGPGKRETGRCTATNPPPTIANWSRRLQFQAAQGWAQIGPSTRDWLNVSPAQRAGVLALNIQRLRLLPGTLSTGIMVNIPAYSLVYYQNGGEVLASRVIVGRPDRKRR